MAHVTLHFSLGMAVATACMAPALRTAWENRTPLAGLFRKWFTFCYLLGIYAVVPSLLRRMGLPNELCDGWWMNLFLFYPLVKKVLSFGGMPLGGAVMFTFFTLQYGITVIAIIRQKRKPHSA
jgi:hypothetical protein